MSDQTFGKVARAAMAVVIWALAVTSAAGGLYLSCLAVNAIFTEIF